MFLSKSSLGKVVRAQVRFKMTAYTGAVLSLIVVQLIGLIISLNGTGSMGTSIDNISIQVNIVTHDGVFMFVAIWALFVGNLITTKAYRYDDFSFVTTRLSGNIANIIILCMVSVFAGVTTFLSNYLLRVVLLLFGSSSYLKSPGILEDPLSSFLNVMMIIILILTAASAGYFGGMLLQKSKVFMVLIPAFIIAIPVTKSGQAVLQYVFVENESMLFLLVKLVSITIILFTLAVVTSNRLEVRT